MSAKQFYESIRRTGRTTRMLTYAVLNAIKYERRVYVLAADYRHVERLSNQLKQILRQNDVAYEVGYGSSLFRFTETNDEVRGSIHILSPGRIDPSHANKDCSLALSAVLEDHYTVECRIQKELEKLHQWDLEQ